MGGLGIIGVIGSIHFLLFLRDMFHKLRTKKFILALRYIFFGRLLRGGVVMIALIIFIYIFCFWIHFQVIIYSGKDDDIMSAPFQCELIGNEIIAPPTFQGLSFISKFLELNRKMVEVNRNSLYEHYYSCDWTKWPIMYHGVMYFMGDLPDNYHMQIYLFGNPLVYWYVLVSIPVSLIFVWKSSLRKQILLCLFGYLANFLPYAFISRTTYLYHYHPSLLFGIFLIGILLDLCTETRKSKRNIFAFCFLLPIFFSYLFFAPFSYGIAISDEQHDLMRWFPSVFPLW